MILSTKQTLALRELARGNPKFEHNGKLFSISNITWKMVNGIFTVELNDKTEESK